MKVAVSYFISDSSKVSGGFDLVNDTSGTMELGQLLQFTKKALITISDEALKEEQDRGFDKKPTLVVDNKLGKSKFDVKPLGQIEYVARRQFKEAVIETYRLILARSKVDSGRYYNSNIVTFNDTPVANSMSQLEAWLKTIDNFQAKDIIRFINVQPYARKLETLGVSKGRSKPRKVTRKKKRGRKQVTLPNGAYHLAYVRAKSKFSKNVFIGMDLLPGDKLGISGPFEKTKFHKRGTRYYGQPYIYPTIILRAVEAGATDVGPRMLQ